MFKYIRTCIQKRIPILAFLGLYLLFSIATYRDYGLTLDEYFVYTRGQYFYTYVRGNDPSIEQSMTQKAKGNDNLLFKNSSYPGMLYVFNDKGVGPGGYEKYHLLNLFFGSIIFYVAYEFLLLLGLTPFYALLGPVMLFFTPRFLGDIPANPKDMPYAVVYMATLLIMLINKKLHPIMRVVLVGVAIGGTASIRQVGLLLLPIYVLFRMYEEQFLSSKDKLRLMRKELPELIGIGILTCAVIVFSYPYLHADPFNRSIELLEINKSFPWNSTVMFFGQSLYPDQRPLLYIPVWIIITTPTLFLALALYPLRKVLTHTGLYLLTLSIGMNILMYIVLNPTVYDGMRHFLYLVPHIILFAAYGAYELMKNVRFKKLVTGLLIAQILLVGYNYITLHPYEYIYFNELIGGLPGAQNQFERDYWGASDKEAMMWLNTHLKSKGIKQARIATCSRSSSIGYYMPLHIDSNNALQETDYFVCYGRFDSLKDIKGTVIHTVKRQGVTLNTIIKVDKTHETSQ